MTQIASLARTFANDARNVEWSLRTIMRRQMAPIRAALVAALTAWNIAGLSAAGQSGGDRSVRSVLRSVPVLQQLRPDDTVLEIVPISSDGEFIRPPEGVSYAEWWTRRHDFAAIIRIKDRKTRLTEDQTFLETDVQAEVVEVLKEPGGKGAILGGTLSFVEQGGELSVGRQRIIGRKVGGVPLETGADYLVWGMIRNGKIILDSPTIYKIVDGHLIDTSTPLA